MHNAHAGPGKADGRHWGLSFVSWAFGENVLWLVCWVVDTVDGSQKSGDHQLRLVVEIPLFTRCYTSQVVVWDFFHQQYLKI